jgi:hypothetical protein
MRPLLLRQLVLGIVELLLPFLLLPPLPLLALSPPALTPGLRRHVLGRRRRVGTGGRD